MDTNCNTERECKLTEEEDSNSITLRMNPESLNLRELNFIGQSRMNCKDAARPVLPNLDYVKKYKTCKNL